MKTCIKCGVERGFFYFKKTKKTIDGYVGKCKICMYGHEPHRKPTIDKTCRICKEIKSVDQFPFVNKEKGWYDSRCKQCNNKRVEALRASTPERRRKRFLKKNWGLTLEDYNLMLEKQKGVCAICNKETGKKYLAIDHCHKTGKIRGLLCFSCNTALGQLQDDTSILLKAIEYLNVKKP